MDSSLFQPLDELTMAQWQAWERRRQLAKILLAQYPAASPAADDLQQLQHYVAGRLTLAQVVARLLDAQARRQEAGLPPR